MTDETDLVAKRYARRKNINPDLYSMFTPPVWQTTQERQRTLIYLLRKHMTTPVKDAKVLEIGCGSGSNLLELIRLGFSPNNLTGNELLPERIQLTKNNLPSSCQVLSGDASTLNVEKNSLDIVYQSTVFTSLLDSSFQKQLANIMWDWVKPGGGVLWYDFIYNNPNNKDVRGVPIARIKALFPEGEIYVKRVTLAPPISRRVTKIHPSFYTLFNAFPFLRSHVLCYIKKPSL